MRSLLGSPASRALVLLLGGGVGAACASSLPEVLAADAAWASKRWPGTTAEDLAQGRDLFSARCAGCHALPSPVVSPWEGWPGIVREMGPRARLVPDEQSLVARYLSAASHRLREVR